MSKDEKRPPRCMLYSPEAPGGRIFEGEEAIEAAQADGWVDSPGDVGEETKPAAKKKAPAKKAS